MTYCPYCGQMHHQPAPPPKIRKGDHIRAVAPLVVADRLGGESITRVAAHHGISIATATKILYAVTNPATKAALEAIRSNRGIRRKASLDDVLKMRDAGWREVDIAAACGVSRQAVSGLLDRHEPLGGDVMDGSVD